MTTRLLQASVLALLMAALAASPAGATAVYTYKKGEYALIADGESPDGQYSIAAHGDGAEGDENFHLYLMTDHGRKRIGPLEEVEHILDTHPKSFEARWAWVELKIDRTGIHSHERLMERSQRLQGSDDSC